MRGLLLRENKQGLQASLREMKLSDIGGEFAFIRRVAGMPAGDPSLVKGVGDDCAVIDCGGTGYLLATTDMMVDNTHFNLAWQTPFQVGRKLMEANVSDIVAMGGTPRWALISLALTPETDVEFMDEFYRGLYESARRHRVVLAGGDTTRGRELVLNLALAGEAERGLVRFRSGASPGDLICVTGTLGGSEAGLRLLMNGKRGGAIDRYLEPRCRLESEGRAIARYADAMIDVSDGLGSEVAHICEESGTGGRIDHDAIPLSKETIEAARDVSGDPFRYALYGGEDFELIFTIRPEKIESLRSEFGDFTPVGTILPREDGVFLVKGGVRMEIGSGYDHFSP